MTAIRTMINTPPWRRRLRQASFKGAPFHVEQIGRASGRRTVLHEYPKRDIPYAEDLGRSAFRYQITGYVIQTSPTNARGNMSYQYDINRDNLTLILMSPGPGVLIDPYNPTLSLGYTGVSGANPLLFMCERFTVVETRERGGVATFEMSFVEAGMAGNQGTTINTGRVVDNNADTTSIAASTSLDQQLKNLGQQRLSGVGALSSGGAIQ